MKKTFAFGLMAAALMLGACAGEDDPTDSTENTEETNDELATSRSCSVTTGYPKGSPQDEAIRARLCGNQNGRRNDNRTSSSGGWSSSSSGSTRSCSNSYECNGSGCVCKAGSKAGQRCASSAACSSACYTCY